MFASRSPASTHSDWLLPTFWRRQAHAWLLSAAAVTVTCTSAWAQAEVATTIKAYPVPAANLQTVAADLKTSLAARREVRIVVDTRANQLLVVGPVDVHQAVSDRLSGKPTVSAANPNLHTLRNVSWKDFEGQLRRVGFVPDVAGTNSGAARYKLKLGTGEEAKLTIVRNEGTVQIQASQEAAPALRKLAISLDRPAARAGEASELVAFNRAEPASVQKLLTWMQAATRPTSPASGQHQHIGEYVSMLFQPGEPPAAGPPVAPGPGGEAPAGDDIPEGGLGDFGRIGNVRIDYIEGLDVMVLTGRKSDVEKVMRLIEQIETQSLETKPEVEVFHLRHVDGRALNDVISQIYDQVFSARGGRVTIVPLVKPNALLLIGRKENLPPLRELIEQLDKPVAPDTQLQVFPLRRISAANAETTVETFFTEPGATGGATGQRAGLGTRVNIVSDARTNSLIVQASPRDLEEVAKLLEKLDSEQTGVVDEVRIFKLRNSLADELVPVLEAAISGQGGTTTGNQTTLPGAQQGGGGTNNQSGTSARPSGALQLLQVDGKGMIESGILADMQLTSDPRGNSIIVTGPAKNMALIEALIRQLDELPATEAQIKVFTIVNGDATQLAELLRQLFGQAAQGGGAGGNQGLQALLQSATGGGDSALVPLRFSVDVRTNSIVASGSTGDLNVVYKVLVRLDEGNIRERITTVYRLRNAPALEVANSLTQLRTQQQQLNQIAPNLNSAPQTLEREVIVVPEQVSNSLIVSATPRYFDEIRRVVEELDRRPNMVIIQVLLAEVSLNDLNEFGVELGLQDSLLFDRGVAGVAGLGRIGYPFNQAGIGNDNTPASLATRENVAAQALSNLSVGRTNASAGFGGLVLSAGNESVNVLIRALQQSQRMQVLSRPQVQTLDNQPAYVQVGQQVPYITSSNQTQFGIQNQTTFQDVGVILGVTPRTSPDGMIVMEIDAVKSDLGPEAEGIAISVSADGTAIRQPIINVTRAQTTVSARSGQTVILGGLITKNQSETTRRVPYLGDIPVLGRLFRFDSVDVQRTELLIIMTPYVMRTDEHVAWLNMRESERMHWCLADVGNIHGQAQHFTSSADSGISTPTIFPDETPAPEGLIAPENLGPGSAQPNNFDRAPGSPNYVPGVIPGSMVPGPNSLPFPPAVPGQSSRRPLQPTPAMPQSQPDQLSQNGGYQALQPVTPLQALPPIPQGPTQFQQQPPFQPVAQPQVQYGPQPAQFQFQSPNMQPAGMQPGTVAPAAYVPQGPNPNFTPLAR
ncbi:Putative type II secretion system protein D precursor [Anatilimnocola aggregata]|uniref:Type II secretion system protein D n=1 Tax=Anatilimnocola aggregata TaxID=2528021 RepID=A0A517Y7D2_9BACT|nr:secretin N-terminal domain-containing protein [Anatilimnocola aggregata]QDU26154.1 Putative type II secretion system protein D precursor [Anatilimnocola aggregata]